MTARRFEPSEYPEVKELFRQTFNVSIGRFLDNEYTAAMAHLVIDFLKFDDWLQEQHGDYVLSGNSMNDIVKKHYGPNAWELLNKLI